MDYVNGEAVDFDTDQNGQISSVKVGIIYENFRLKYFQSLYVQGNMRAPASYPDVSRAREKGRREGLFPWSLAAHHQSLASTLRKTKHLRRRLYARYMISINLRSEYFFFVS